MAVSSFKYCSQRDVKDVYPNLDETDSKVVIRNWKDLGGDKYAADNTGLVTALYRDGAHLDSAQANSGAVDADYKWYYSSQWDRLYLHDTTTNPNELLIEAGEDWATLIDRMIVNCSMELSAMLDARFPRPIPKAFQYAEATDGSDTPEYDYIVKRATALLVAHHLLISKNPKSEEAELLMAELTNVDNTGIVDRLNDGRMKLSFEVDRKDQSGDVVEVTRAGTMYLVETSGSWSGAKYDRLKLKCTIAGVYGTAEIEILGLGSDKLYGGTYTTSLKVTGGMQEVNGIYFRFEGNSMSENDEFHIIVRNYQETNTNAGVRTIRATHGNKVSRDRLLRDNY